MLFCWPFSFGLSRRRVPQINPKRRQKNISAQVWKERFSWIFSEKCMFWTWFLQCVGLHDKKERKKGRILAQTVIELCSNHVGKYKLYNSKAMQVPLIFLIFSYFSFCLQEVLTSTKRMANGKALPASFFWCAQTVQLSTSFARPTRRGQNLPMLSMNYPPLPSGPSEPVMLLFPNLRRLWICLNLLVIRAWRSILPMLWILWSPRWKQVWRLPRLK